MCAQTAAGMPAAGEALQECAALSHGAACLVRPWSLVACDALLVGLIGLPVDVTSMMLFEILIDDENAILRPAEFACLAGKRILALRRFAIVLDLRNGRLTVIAQP